MFTNYLKIAFRHLKKNKMYSFINIAGLCIGLLISTLILLFVLHEVQFDKFHVNGDSIYKVEMIVRHGDQNFNIDGINAELGPKIKETNAAVLDFVRIKDLGKVVFKNSQYPDIYFKENSFLFADKSLFSVFTYPLRSGDVHTALQNPFSLLLSEKAAEKYFGHEDPVGKTLWCNGKHLFTITGVFQNVPSNSSLSFDFVTSLETYPKLGAEEKNIWENSGAFRTYLLLNDKSKKNELEKTMAGLKKDLDITYSLIQYSSQHLGGGFNKNLNARFVYIFSGIGLLILFLALFNYMSLTTSYATTRSKEVCIRKVAGVNRMGLIRQFYVESMVLCSISFGFAFILIQLFLPSFYNVLGVRIDSSFLSNPSIVAGVSALFLFCVLIAGSYPALVLSKFVPIEVLKGKFSGKNGGSAIRRGIIVFQFMVSVTLIICVIISNKQLSFLRSKDLGFTQSQVLAIPTEGAMKNNFISFKNDIKQLSGVQSIASATTPFYKGYNAWFSKSTKSGKEVFLYSMTADENFFNTIGLKWAVAPVHTANLDKKIYINESAAKELELDKEILGQRVDLGDSPIEVGGVLKDFHFNALREDIKPLTINVYSEHKIDFEKAGQNPTLYVRFDASSDLSNKVASIKDMYAKYNTESPFEYYFLDDAFNETFAAQSRMSFLFSIFMFVALFLACMGLFGLATFMAESRIKEVGIRKVLGASVAEITKLMSKDFLILVSIGIILAFPLAYYFMNKWLADFAFRIDLSGLVFLSAGMIAIGIAVLTISFQSIRTAISNPIKSLRAE